MQETPQQYTARLLSYVEGKSPLPILKSTPLKIYQLIKEKKKAALYTRPAPRKWSVAEIVAHLAETEIVMAWRYRSIAEKSGVKLQPFDQDVWAANSRYASSDMYEMMDLFAVTRRANLSFVTKLPVRSLNKFGLHMERGKETIRHIMKLEAGHDINHLRQIQNILASK